MDHRPNTIEQRHSPVRRSGALEAAARALGQAEDEWGAARSHLDPPPGAAREDARVRAASAIAPWSALRIGTPCARDGTPGGRPGRVGAWWITPGEAAVRRDGPGVQGCSGDRWREVLALYSGWVRPRAEEGA